MNKYEVVLDVFKNKILFLFERYDYNNNKILILKDLSFLLITSFIVITQLLRKSPCQDRSPCQGRSSCQEPVLAKT